MDNALAVINVALISNAPLSKSNLTIGLDNTIAPIDIGITKSIILFELFTIYSLNFSLLSSCDNFESIG